MGATIDDAICAFKDPRPAFVALTAADVDYLLSSTPVEAFWRSLECVRVLLMCNV